MTPQPRPWFWASAANSIMTSLVPAKTTAFRKWMDLQFDQLMGSKIQLYLWEFRLFFFQKQNMWITNWYKSWDINCHFQLVPVEGFGSPTAFHQLDQGLLTVGFERTCLHQPTRGQPWQRSLHSSFQSFFGGRIFQSQTTQFLWRCYFRSCMSDAMKFTSRICHGSAEERW